VKVFKKLQFIISFVQSALSLLNLENENISRSMEQFGQQVAAKLMSLKETIPFDLPINLATSHVGSENQVTPENNLKLPKHGKSNTTDFESNVA